MTDDERAEQLARAIDNLIRGIESPDTSHGLGDDELNALLDVARDRLETGRSRRDQARAYEDDVWEGLMDRVSLQASPAPQIDLPPGQHDALRDIITLRMQMAREVLDIAETHRDQVWQRIQFRMGQRIPDTSAPSTHETPIEPPNEAEVEAITRRSLARLAEIASDPVQMRFRERLRRDARSAAHGATPQPRQPSSGAARRRLAVGIAAVLVVTAALAGPLPVTGLDGHPAFQIAESVATRIGVTGAEGAAAAQP